MGRRVVAMLVAGTALAAGCSGDDDVAPSTTAAPVPVESLDPVTTTTVSSTPATAESTTTSTSTTTTSTTMEPVDEEAEVVAAFQAGWTAFNEAKLDPTNDAKVQAARALLADEILAAFDDRIAFFRDNNYKSVTDTELPARATIVNGSVVVTSPVAVLTFCDLDSNTLVEVGGLPDGGDAVVDESITARLADVGMRLEDGRWRQIYARTVEEYPGSATCDG